MAGSLFGQYFRVTTFGESHGKALGCVIDGMPAQALLSESDIQPFLEQRRPGTSKFVTQRQESDKVQILSGVFEGKTTGTPITLMIENTDQRSHDYGEIAHSFRPGHGDYTWHKKFGFRDYRGGGRASARETAARVAAGAVARKLLGHIQIYGGVTQIGHLKANSDNFDWQYAKENPLNCPDKDIFEQWADFIDEIRRQKDSIGAICEVRANAVPAGLGEPVFDKLDADLAKAIMSIPAVKAVEIGDGMNVATLKGSQNADEIRIKEGKPYFTSNHAGGILGGISNGDEIIIRFAVKPTSSILIPRKTINENGKEIELITRGRHDPCVAIRAIPVAEAMVAMVLADFTLRQSLNSQSLRT